jgi:hypothetical protein
MAITGMKWLLARFRAWYARAEEECPREALGYACKGSKVCDHGK